MNREEIEGRITELLLKRLRNELTAGEQEELEEYRSRGPLLKAFIDKWEDEQFLSEKLKRKSQIDTEAAWKLLEKRSGTAPVTVMRSIMRNKWLMAASLTGVIAAGAIFLTRQGGKQIVGSATVEASNKEILPAKGQVILTLADGNTIPLNTQQGELIANQGNNELINKNNELVYVPGTVDATPNKTLINKSSYRLQQSLYRLKLADGTRVWLNAQSELIFPASFSGNERKVELSGQGYFEVASDNKRPFLVKTNNTEIKVLVPGLM